MTCIIIVLTVVLYLADQLLKLMAQAWLQKPLTVISGLLVFRYEKNTGIAWSIALPPLLIIIMNIALLLVLPFFLIKNLKLDQKLSWLIVSFLLAGALGNLTDRLLRGYVIDFLAIGRFPVFNLADALITISIFLILVFHDKITRTGKSSPKK